MFVADDDGTGAIDCGIVIGPTAEAGARIVVGEAASKEVSSNRLETDGACSAIGGSGADVGTGTDAGDTATNDEEGGGGGTDA